MNIQLIDIMCAYLYKKKKIEKKKTKKYIEYIKYIFTDGVSFFIDLKCKLLICIKAFRE